MRWLSGLLLLVTIATVAWLGLSATSFSLSNTGSAVACRSVLAPITNASLDSTDEVPFEVVEEWLIDVGSDENGVVPADVFNAAASRAHDLCSEARTGRLGWMILFSVLGLAASAGAAMLARQTAPQPAAPQPTEVP